MGLLLNRLTVASLGCKFLKPPSCLIKRPSWIPICSLPELIDRASRPRDVRQRRRDRAGHRNGHAYNTYYTRKTTRFAQSAVQNFKAAKRPNAKTPRDEKVKTTTVYERVDRYTKDGSAQYGLKAVTYTSAEVVPPHQALRPSDFAKKVAENPLSKQLNRAKSAEHDSDSESASECGSIQSGSFCADDPIIEPSDQAPKPKLQPIHQSPRSQWRVSGWIRSSAFYAKSYSRL